MTHDSRLDPIGPSPEQHMEAVRAAAEATVEQMKKEWQSHAPEITTVKLGWYDGDEPTFEVSRPEDKPAAERWLARYVQTHPAEPLPAPERTEEQAVVEAARALTEVWRALPGAQTVPIDDAMFALVETLTNLDVAALARSTPAPSDGGETNGD